MGDSLRQLNLPANFFIKHVGVSDPLFDILRQWLPFSVHPNVLLGRLLENVIKQRDLVFTALLVR